jgi:predicted nicotinamide N-methyase
MVHSALRLSNRHSMGHQAIRQRSLARAVVLTVLHSAAIGNREMDLDEAGLDLFKEPEAEDAPLYQSTLQEYSLQSGKKLQIQLVTRHILWSHVLYPSSICMSHYLEDHAELCKGKAVLELGAAGGLPSLVGAALDAKMVGQSPVRRRRRPDSVAVMTDFPDPSLVSNLEQNIALNGLAADQVKAAVRHHLLSNAC